MRGQSTLTGFVLALALTACASAPRGAAPDNLISPNFQQPQTNSLIVLLPPEIETLDLQPGAPLAMDALHQSLTAAGYKVVALDKGSYEAIWAQEVEEVGGIYDPGTGILRQRELNLAMGHMAQRVCAETRAAMVLRPLLVLRPAELSGMSALWDGQQRRVPSFGGEVSHYKGGTIGLSVSLEAVAASGELVMRTHGGASLPFRVNLNSAQSEVRSDLFANGAEIADGVKLALAPLLKR